MKLTLSRGILYADGLFFSYAEAGNGRSDFQPGRYEVEARYSHTHGQDLPIADGVGWFGPAVGTDAPCDIVLGRVRAGNALLPCPSFIGRLLALIETAEDRGQTTTLVIE